MSKGTLLFVEARFYEDLADFLAEGAVAAIQEAGYEAERVSVPGALEIPPAIAFAAEGAHRGKHPAFAGFVALGCVIRGQTAHFEHVATQSAAGLMALGLERHLAIGNGILTVETREQALERARPDRRNIGGGAARACLRLIELRKAFGAARD